jgi:hypothetical protein
MVAAANLVEVAALVGDTARATMFGALMDGQSIAPRSTPSPDQASPNTDFSGRKHLRGCGPTSGFNPSPQVVPTTEILFERDPFSGGLIW